MTVRNIYKIVVNSLNGKDTITNLEVRKCDTGNGKTGHKRPGFM